jgi:hypothetical protein
MQNDQGRSECSAQLSAIKALLALHEQEGNIQATDEIREEIEQIALSVEIRSDWHAPGTKAKETTEYKILLCTGGPEVRVHGRLNRFHQPDTAILEYRNWFTEWTKFPTTREDEKTLLEFARFFYFGE